MITKVNRIKDFGIFKSFSWSLDVNTFKQKNLIYGWNYSGKTTLSKLFNNLEKKNKIHFPSAEYIVEISRNSETYNQDTLNTFPYLVKVFNADYIKNVFSFDKENDGFNPISFYLGDKAGDIQPQIDKRTLVNQRFDFLIKNKYNPIVNIYNDYSKESGKFSSQATNIRRYLSNRIASNEFNKKQFNDIVIQIKTDIANALLGADKIEETKQQAIAENIWQLQNEDFPVVEKLIAIGTNVDEILKDIAPSSVSFPEFDESETLFNWVQLGLPIHEKETICKFCNNPFSEERRNTLNKYYSEKLKEIQKAIKDVRLEIEAERNNLGFEFTHESNISTHLQEKYKTAVANYIAKNKLYLDVLNVFEADLKIKESDYFNSITPSVFTIVSLNDELANLIEVVKEHNLFVTNFETTKTDALKAILKHYVAEYLTDEDYLTKETNSKNANQIIANLSQRIAIYNNEIDTLNGKLKDTVKGQEELNKYLGIFLNRDDIKIEIENSKFILKRATFPAKNLSEGEKTAIAFAYFLTELKSLKEEKKLKDSIIFFDDPISSLDSNHIFQVRSLINHFFEKTEDYLQLFISTHNFEFFSVMLDSNLFKRFNKQDIGTEKCPFYLINRTTANTSTIKNLPISLRSHKSEYAHLFSILKDYNELLNKEDFEFKILLPNALRRFLELYSLFKYPKGFSEIDDRLKKIFQFDDTAYHNTKLYHWFSHQNQMEKVAQHDSKIILIDDAIKEILDYIENKDALHWEGLTKKVQGV